jgi:AcrR family transcriptional regulator
MKRASGLGPATTRDAYHHGNLRSALLKAAEDIIRESGVEGLTLRDCARRAGVSHGAPANHFGNLTGLLTELAAEGFERLTQAMAMSKVKDADNELEAAGLGYIQFAMQWPEHFRVMWRSEALNQKSLRLQQAREAAQQRLRDALMHTNAHRPTLSEEELATRFQLAWCCVHGYASLWVEGNRRSHSLDEAKGMLRLLRPSLVQ